MGPLGTLEQGQWAQVKWAQVEWAQVEWAQGLWARGLSWWEGVDGKNAEETSLGGGSEIDSKTGSETSNVTTRDVRITWLQFSPYH